MSRISDIKVIKEFINDDITYGVYSVNFNGEQKIFIRNGESVGVITFKFDEPATNCICTIRNDVKEELFLALKKIN